MSYETVLVERKEDVGIIKLNRAEKRNALGAQLIEDMLGALDELDNDPDVHVIVLTSNVPRIFSAGRDLAEASADMTADILKQREISRNPARLSR